MSLLTENQLTDIVYMIVDDYGSRLTGGEVSEVIGLILENTSGFETVDSNTFTQAINEIGNLHDFRYDVRAHTERGLRNRVISVRKCLSKDSTLGG
jgi:CRISPR/Cas system-associated protein Cas10 (large subunit of type III CRISPR-Cas system)